VCSTHLNNLSIASAEAGDHSRAVDLAREALGLAVAVGDRHRQAALHDRLADLHHATGRPAESQVELTEAASLFSTLRGTEDWEPELWLFTRW
jgi:hypothetical protein